MVYLQGKSWMIHTRVLLGWGSQEVALYKCSAFAFTFTPGPRLATPVVSAPTSPGIVPRLRCWSCRRGDRGTRTSVGLRATSSSSGSSRHITSVDTRMDILSASACVRRHVWILASPCCPCLSTSQPTTEIIIIIIIIINWKTMIANNNSDQNENVNV